MLIALLWLASSVELVNEVHDIPANEWRYLPVAMNQRPARVSSTFKVQPPGGPVRLVLLPQAALPAFRAGRRYTPLAAAGPALAGSLQARPREPGEYVLIVDNRGNLDPAGVALRVNLDFGGPQALVRYADPARRILVIAAGFALFAGVSIWSARKLIPALRKPPPPL
jgi:hypothetical protein